MPNMDSRLQAAFDLRVDAIKYLDEHRKEVNKCLKDGDFTDFVFDVMPRKMQAGLSDSVVDEIRDYDKLPSLGVMLEIWVLA
jgi:hypothetical protein